MQNNQNNDTVFYYFNTMDKTTIDYKEMHTKTTLVCLNVTTIESYLYVIV